MFGAAAPAWERYNYNGSCLHGSKRGGITVVVLEVYVEKKIIIMQLSLLYPSLSLPRLI